MWYYIEYKDCKVLKLLDFIKIKDAHNGLSKNVKAKIILEIRFLKNEKRSTTFNNFSNNNCGSCCSGFVASKQTSK